MPGRQIAEIFGITAGRLWEQIDANILSQSGDRHRRLRALVGPAFNPRAADRRRPAMRGFLRDLWDETTGSCEFVEPVAKPYPSPTIAAVLGAPPEDEGERLSHAECVNLVLNVLAGGVDTTQAQLAQALRLFAEHPGQWALLAGDPGLVGQAVQEVLRHEPITPFTARICVEEVEHRGVVFPAGTIVAICTERANRDSGSGEGERFDISGDRDHRLLTFGAGAHFRLGADLARAELEEALAFLAPRLPDRSNFLYFPYQHDLRI
jgi:cytochrome P450